MRRISTYIVFACLLLCMSHMVCASNVSHTAKGKEDNKVTVQVTEDPDAFGGYIVTVQEKEAGALKEGTEIYSYLEVNGLALMVTGIYTKGDIEFMHYIDESSVFIRKASTQPSTMTIEYELKETKTQDYGKHDLMVTWNKGETAIFKNAVNTLPRLPRRMDLLDKEVRFEKNRSWYLCNVRENKPYLAMQAKRMASRTYCSQGKLMVPLGSLVTELDDSKKVVNNKSVELKYTVKGESQLLKLQVGQKAVYINGTKQLLQTAPELKKDIIFVPINEFAKLMSLETATYEKGVSIFIPRMKDEKAIEVITAPNLVKHRAKERMQKIVIIEGKKKRLKEGDIIINLQSEEDIQISELPMAIVQCGDVRLGQVEIDPTNPKRIRIPVVQASTQPSSILIKGLSVDIGRTVPEIEFEFTIEGEALGEVVSYKTEVGTV